MQTDLLQARWQFILQPVWCLMPNKDFFLTLGEVFIREFGIFHFMSANIKLAYTVITILCFTCKVDEINGNLIEIIFVKLKKTFLSPRLYLQVGHTLELQSFEPCWRRTLRWKGNPDGGNTFLRHLYSCMFLSCQLGASLDDGVVDHASLHGVNEIDNRQRCLVRLVLEVFDLGALPSFTQLKKIFQFFAQKQSPNNYPVHFLTLLFAQEMISLSTIGVPSSLSLELRVRLKKR